MFNVFFDSADSGRLFFGVRESSNNPDSIIGTVNIDTDMGLLTSSVRTRSDSNKQVNGKVYTSNLTNIINCTHIQQKD